MSIWLHYRLADDAPGWYPGFSRSQHPPLTPSLSRAPSPSLSLSSAARLGDLAPGEEKKILVEIKTEQKIQRAWLFARGQHGPLSLEIRSLDWWRRGRTGVLVSRAPRRNGWMKGPMEGSAGRERSGGGNVTRASPPSRRFFNPPTLRTAPRHHPSSPPSPRQPCARLLLYTPTPTPLTTNLFISRSTLRVTQVFNAAVIFLSTYFRWALI